MPRSPVQAIILGAGKGTRMKSAMPKVLHKIAGRSMLGHVIDIAHRASCDRVAVVVGPGMADVTREAVRLEPNAQVFTQVQQLGTADAVLSAGAALGLPGTDTIVLYADTPLLQPETIRALQDALDAGAAIAVLGFRAIDPSGYGRLLLGADGALVAIREHKDASANELKVDLCNSGVMAFRCPDLAALLKRIGNVNAKGEYYLTDAVELARADGLKCAVVVCPEDEVLGINARDQLAAAEAIYQQRFRRRVMAEGATLIAPDTVWFSYDTVIGRDVVIEPNVFFGAGVRVEDGAEIKANCHIEGAVVGKGARIGPFARLRPGAVLGEDVHIGNFVEVKNVVVGNGAKANHLAYLGDGTVGAKANIGAGTIFCNYDGFNKSKTQIGEGAFVGSNTSLVAPVRIGAGAYVGSGSVITKDVPEDSLSIERNTQETRVGWAAKFRQVMSKRKAAKAG